MKINFANNFIAFPIGKSKQHLGGKSYIDMRVLLYLQNLAIFIAIILSLETLPKFSTFLYIFSISILTFCNLYFNFLTLRLYSSLLFTLETDTSDYAI